MEESFNGHQTTIQTYKNEIRINQCKLLAEIETFKKELNNISFQETSQICEKVQDLILDFQDEPYLSKIQNNCRRFFIASELFIEICNIHELMVDYKFTDIISNIVQWEKYKRISKKIFCKNLMEVKKEKYFAEEAQTKILKSCEDKERKSLDENYDMTRLNEVAEHEYRLREEVQEYSVSALPEETATQAMSPTQSEILHPSIIQEHLHQVSTVLDEAQHRPIETVETGTEAVSEYLGNVKAKERTEEFESLTEKENLFHSTLKSPQLINLEKDKEQTETEMEIVAAFGQKSTGVKSDIVEGAPHFEAEENLENITQIREELMSETYSLGERCLDVPRQNLTLPNIVAETSIRSLSIGEKNNDNIEDINQILQILEDQTPAEKIIDIEPPEGVPEPQSEITDNIRIEEAPREDETHPVTTEPREEWILPDLEPTVETEKKERQLIIDKETYIPGYAARALHLNRNIKIERVQVYEGPPRILKAISAGHLMTTSGFGNSIFQSVRSCKLNSLFKRHLKVEKKTLQETITGKGILEKPREFDISKTARVDVVEDLEHKAPFSSALEKSVLADIISEKNLLTDLDISAIGIPTKESLIGKPISRIINPVVEPPSEMQMEIINSTLLPPSPRVKQLQGKRAEVSTASTWFETTKKSPPSCQFTDLNKVYETVKKYWLLNENHGMDKCLTLSEFFSFENENERSSTNYLTVLRVLDKLSIRRKILLEYKNSEVYIFPFEKPYVTDGQLIFAERELLY